MNNAGGPRHDAVPIGEIAAPPFVRLPEPELLFFRRAERFRALADGAGHPHKIAPYLIFLADIADMQHRLQDGLPQVDPIEPDALGRARQFGMPPLDRNRFKCEPAFESTLDRLFSLCSDIDMPEMARGALVTASSADPLARDAMVRNVLADSIPTDRMAEHALVAAALQVHFARLAAGLDAKSLAPVGDGACPSCGAPPVSSAIVGWHGAAGTRFCVCSLCQTWWHYVRIKCTLCGSTKGIGYKEIEGRKENVKAETCDQCRGYVKILQQHVAPALDPVADDIATLGLDFLVREAGYRRGAVNPFLLGY